LDRRHNRFLRFVSSLRKVLRLGEVRRKNMTTESFIMVLISAATGVYLLYALLRPEKF